MINYKMYEKKEGIHFIFILMNLSLISDFDKDKTKIYFDERK